MFRGIHQRRRAQAVSEYVILVLLIISALILFQKYIARGIWGRWKSSGDAIGQGMVFDPTYTTECSFDDKYYNVWYNAVCYKNNCDCLSFQATNTTCQSCIQGCMTPKCN